MNEENYRVYSVNGPVVTVKGGRGLAMQDMVYVGKSRLIGEVVGIEPVSYTHLVFSYCR